MNKRENKSLKQDFIVISTSVLTLFCIIIFLPLQPDYGKILEKVSTWNFNLVIGVFFALIIASAFSGQYSDKTEYGHKSIVTLGVFQTSLSLAGLLISNLNSDFDKVIRLQKGFILVLVLMFLLTLLALGKLLFNRFKPKSRKIKANGHWIHRN